MKKISIATICFLCVVIVAVTVYSVASIEKKVNYNSDYVVLPGHEEITGKRSDEIRLQEENKKIYTLDSSKRDYFNSIFNKFEHEVINESDNDETKELKNRKNRLLDELINVSKETVELSDSGELTEANTA